MTTRTICVVSKEPRAGSFFVGLGLMEILKGLYKRVALFKPIVASARERDRDIETMLAVFGLRQRYEEAAGLEVAEVERLLAEGREGAFYEAIISRHEALLEAYDFVLCLGLADRKLRELVDFDPNLAVAKNLSAPVAGVLNGAGKESGVLAEEIALWQQSIREEGIAPVAFFINHAEEGAACRFEEHLPFRDVPCFLLPHDAELDRPTVLDLLERTGGEVIHGKGEGGLERTIGRPLVAAMRPENFLGHFREGDLVIVPADRADILLAILSANRIPGFPTAAAVVLGGETPVPEQVMRMVEADESFRVVLIRVPWDTMGIILLTRELEAAITPAHRRKVDRALGHFAAHVDAALIEKSLQRTRLEVVTPTMFLHRLFARATADRRRVVLPESDDERILRAAESIQRRKIADITLLGDPAEVRNRAGILGVDLEGITVVDPAASPWKEGFVETFYRLRRHKGITKEQAKDAMENLTYFATMMVYAGYADAMVSGATHTTRETVLPALQIIKTKPGIDIVSSVFFMCLETRVLVYGDCAIVPDPTPEELAQIAIESAETARAFGIEPVVALLSYSTGHSGVGKDVEKVRRATKLAQQMRPDLPIEGPMQYDAAIDPEVARRKMPGSKVAGRATVFVFPDLNTGNNTYKAVQRATGAIAIGPVLQGLKKPVNDLSRGCTVEDVISTVAITAVQAQQTQKEG